MGPPALALEGLTILVTRPEDRAAKLRAMLEAHGAEVVVSPTIETVSAPEDSDRPTLVDELMRAHEYDWVVVVSPTTVELLRKAGAAVRRTSEVLRHGRELRGADTDGEEVLPPFATVGPATAQGLREGGFEVRFQPDEATGEALAEGLAANHNLNGVRILYPRSDIGSAKPVEILRGAGAEVVEVVAYHTLPLKPAAEAAAMIDAGEIDCVLFASSSAVLGYHLLESESARTVPAIAIGRSTAERVRWAGLTLAGTADPHTAEGLVQAVLGWAGSRPG